MVYLHLCYEDLRGLFLPRRARCTAALSGSLQVHDVCLQRGLVVRKLSKTRHRSKGASWNHEDLEDPHGSTRRLVVADDISNAKLAIELGK